MLETAQSEGIANKSTLILVDPLTEPTPFINYRARHLNHYENFVYHHSYKPLKFFNNLHKEFSRNIMILLPLTRGPITDNKNQNKISKYHSGVNQKHDLKNTENNRSYHNNEKSNNKDNNSNFNNNSNNSSKVNDTNSSIKNDLTNSEHSTSEFANVIKETTIVSRDSNYISKNGNINQNTTNVSLDDMESSINQDFIAEVSTYFMFLVADVMHSYIVEYCFVN